MKTFLSSIFYLFLSAQLHAAPMGVTEAWTGISNPLIMTPNFVSLFNYLPLSGNITDPSKYWSGDYWARRNGLINYRWKALTPSGWDQVAPTKEELLVMPADKIMELSPSEKYDILLGKYDYPLKAIVTGLANRNAAGWEGMCHGWAPAAINHNEPIPKVLKNPDGIEVPFGSADIKGLLSFFYANAYPVRTTHQMGSRCYQEESGDLTQCNNDLNAGAFHIVLTNMIAIKNTGFVADLVRTAQVWNHPIYGYETKVTGYSEPLPKSARGTETVVRVTTTVKYGSEYVNSWEPTNGTSAQMFNKKIFEYDLELNNYGDIIGGEWVSDNRPDFLWLKNKPTSFTGFFAELGQLLND